MKIRLDGVVGWDITAADLADKLEGATDVHLIINSGGGSILEGLSIYELLDAHEGTITAQVDFAASMASVIAMAADEIIMNEKTSLMMIHRPWSGTVGDADELRKTADTLDKMEGMLSSIYLDRAGDLLDPDSLSDLLDAETWLTASEAKEIGLADTVKKSGSAKNLFDAALVAMRGQDQVLKYDLNKLSLKMAAMANEKPPVSAKLKTVESLADVERVIRDDLNGSQADATAIVAAVKRVTGDGDHVENVEVMSAFDKLFKPYSNNDVSAAFERVISGKSETY